MISTREEAELMFRKWMESSSTIFFTALRSDRTLVNSFYGNIVGVSENLVLVMGEGVRAEIDLGESQFAFVTEHDLSAEMRRDLTGNFDSGLFISKVDGSMYAFLEVDEK